MKNVFTFKQNSAQVLLHKCHSKKSVKLLQKSGISSEELARKKKQGWQTIYFVELKLYKKKVLNAMIYFGIIYVDLK